MRKLQVITINDIDKEVFFNSYKSNLFELEDHKYFFTSRFTNHKEEIDFKYIEINLEDEKIANLLYKFLVQVCYESVEEANKLSEEPMGHVMPDKTFESIIFSKITKYSYDQGNKDIFDFIGEIFISLLMNHVLSNGNKRTATMFLKLSLKHLGYYFKWTSDFYMKADVHNDQIQTFASNLSTKNSCAKIEKTKEEIFKWIKENVMIDMRLENE